jgi:hypothetical protein
MNIIHNNKYGQISFDKNLVVSLIKQNCNSNTFIEFVDLDFYNKNGKIWYEINYKMKKPINDITTFTTSFINQLEFELKTKLNISSPVILLNINKDETK